jgi:hypothetical protein
MIDCLPQRTIRRPFQNADRQKSCRPPLLNNLATHYRSSATHYGKLTPSSGNTLWEAVQRCAASKGTVPGRNERAFHPDCDARTDDLSDNLLTCIVMQLTQFVRSPEGQTPALIGRVFSRLRSFPCSDRASRERLTSVTAHPPHPRSPG